MESSPKPTNHSGPPQMYFERRFKYLIEGLGTFKIKCVESKLLMPYFKIKLQCESNLYSYETIVIGDEYDDEADARENVFRKACNVMTSKFKRELEDIGKVRRRTSNTNTCTA